MQGIVLLLAWAVSSACAGSIQPPDEYPSEPSQAAAAYYYAVDTLGAQTGDLPDGDVRPEGFVGRAIVVQGTLSGRIAVSCSDGRSRRVIVRIETDEGQSICAVSSSELAGLRDGEPVRAVVEVPTGGDGKPRFELRAVVLEGDLPLEAKPAVSAPATAKTAPVAPPATPTVQLSNGQFRVPPLAPLAATAEKLPRPGKDGTWDPVGGIGYPLVSEQTLKTWIPWMRRHNRDLSERQADWIARWVIYYSALNAVDHRLMFAMIKCESDFNPHCQSHAGAVGLTQLMPCNLKDFHVVNKWNVQEQVRAGVEHFKEMLDMWEGRSNYAQFALAAASYNAGPNAVKRAGGIPNYTETKNYVKKLGDLFLQLCQAGYP